MRRLIYLLGEPGVGKTTLMREVLARLGVDTERVPLKWGLVVYQGTPELLVLGDYRPAAGTYGGTDKLSMAVQPQAERFLRQLAEMPNGPAIILGEGDRLATVGFFTAAAAAGWEVNLVLLVTSEERLQARRRHRQSNQNEKWLKGRVTKLANLWGAATREFPAVAKTLPFTTMGDFKKAVTALVQLATVSEVSACEDCYDREACLGSNSEFRPLGCPRAETLQRKEDRN